MSTDDAYQRLLDLQELNELVIGVARATDRCDDQLFLSCYWDDAYDDHGTYKGDPAGFLTHLKRRTMDPAYGPVQHSITNMRFDIRGDIAYGESYVESRVVSDGDVTRGLARYIDRYERRSGVWKIASRRAILELARPGFDVSHFVPGTRDRSDPSYERQVVEPSASVD